MVTCFISSRHMRTGGMTSRRRLGRADAVRGGNGRGVATCGSGFIIGLKLPCDDGVAGSIRPPEAALVTDRLTAPGNIDYVCFAGGSHARTLEMHTPDRHGPPMPYMDIIKDLKRSANGVPVMALGRITAPAEATASATMHSLSRLAVRSSPTPPGRRRRNPAGAGIFAIA